MTLYQVRVTLEDGHEVLSRAEDFTDDKLVELTHNLERLLSEDGGGYLTLDTDEGVDIMPLRRIIHVAVELVHNPRPAEP